MKVNQIANKKEKKLHFNVLAALLGLLLCFSICAPTWADNTDMATDDIAIISKAVGENADEKPADENADEANEPAEPERLTGTTVVENTATLTLGSTQASITGVAQTLDVAPFATNGTAMLPLRFIAQDILGAAVEWDHETGLVRVKRDAISITIDLTYGKVYYGGKPYMMPVKPMVVDNCTLVPLRLISELMNCKVQYDAATQGITVHLPQPLVVEPPVAAITYLPACAGQTIPYQDDSFDPAGYAITGQEWQVTNEAGDVRTGSSLYWLFYQRQGGDYHITYRVKNAYDVWSEPVEADYHLDYNNAPVITGLSAASTNVDIGETLDITYDYENEDWEEIANVSFTYTWEDARGNRNTNQGKPAAFFTSGRHTVTLKIKDAFGQWSEPMELQFNVSDTVQATEAEYRFANLVPGEIYLNTKAYNFNGLLQAETTSVARSNITLIDSNSPEKVTAPALLYQDTVTGNAAVHYHHINAGSTPLKFYIIAHNQSSQPATYTVGKSGFAGPSADPMQVGYIETQNYLGSSNAGQTITLKPGQMALLNAEQMAAVSPNCLQSALVDINVTGKLAVAVVAMQTTDNWRNYQQLPQADAVGPQTRGTYTNAAYNISVTLGDDAQKIMLGYPDSFNSHIDDYLIAGVDKMTNKPTYNKGNYGVVHRVTITATSNCGILLNPRGSIYRGALLWNDEVVLLSASGQIKTTQECVIVGTMTAGDVATITYITPDGSDSPCLIVSIPADQWHEF